LTTAPDGREQLIEAGASAVYLSVEQVGQALARHGLRRRQERVPATVTLDVGSDPRPPAPLRPVRDEVEA